MILDIGLYIAAEATTTLLMAMEMHAKGTQIACESGIYHEHAQRKPVRKITPCLTSVFYGVIKSTKKTLKTLYTRTPPTPGFEPRMMGICERSDTTAMNGRDSTGYQAHLIVHCKPLLTTCDVNSVVKGIEHQASDRKVTGSSPTESMRCFTCSSIHFWSINRVHCRERRAESSAHSCY